MELIFAGIGTLGIALFALWAVSLSKSVRQDRVDSGVDDSETLEADLGEWLHDQLMERFGLETEAWAIERVGRIESRLNECRAPRPPVKVEILWMQEMTAFVGRGDYIYVSRELLQRTTTDDSAALVVAHEMGHKDLGHTDLFQGQWKAVRHIPQTALFAALSTIVSAQLYSLEREQAADDYGVDLCQAAGYDPAKCMELFDILEAYSIDMGDIDGVYGRDPVVETDSLFKNLIAQASESVSKRQYGYPSLRERRASAEARMKET